MTKTLPERISELETLSTTELRARWEQAIKRPTPKRASRDLLRRTLTPACSRASYVTTRETG